MENPRVGKEILTYDDLLQIVELIKSAESFSEFHLKIGDIELDLRKAGTGSLAAPPVVNASAMAAEPAPSAGGSATVPPTEGSTPARRAPDIPAGAVTIKSPMVGTFYRAPEPGARPFVEV